MKTFEKKIAPLLTDKDNIVLPYFRKKIFKHFSVTVNSTEVIIEKNDTFYEIFCSSISSLAYCCGILEIGDIFIRGDRDSHNYIEQNKKEFEQALDYALNTMLRLLSNKKFKGRKNVFICNLIPVNEGCILLREAFIRTGYFRLIKSFVNKNSGNLVEIWISNI